MKALALAAALAALPLLPSTAAAEPAQAMTRGLNHLGLTVSKLDASVAFFTDTLGWRIAGGDKDYPAVYVTDGQLFLTLWQTPDPAAAIPFNRKTNVGLHHLALTVDSFEVLDALYQRFLKTPGVVIEFGPELNGGGPTKHMMIREPSGNRLEFAHNPPRR